MSEERASREGSSRRSGGSRDGHGDRLDKALGEVGTGAGDAGTVGGGIGGGEYGDLRPTTVPRQAPQGHPGGAGRRRAGEAEPFDAAEFAAALHESVSAIGASGPPRAGLARIRRRAKARQRRRTLMASSAGVLLLAMAVGVATGSSFDIVPVLTGVVGLGGSNSDGGSSPQTPGTTGVGQVRTVRPPADATGKRGPAIGPVGTVAGTPAALAATGVPECTATDLTTVAMVDSVIGGVSYGHMEAVATMTCAVAGPPVLKVENAAGTAASSVVILQHMVSDGSQLPNVTTWGAVLKLQAGQGYDFQFAWAPDACVGSSTGTLGGATTGASPSTGASVGSAAGQSPASAYSLSYLVAQVTPTEPVDLNASCGATVYVTDVYAKGAYPLPKPPATATAQPPASSAPATSPAPVTQPPASSTAPVTTTAPTTPSSSAGASSGASASSGSTGGVGAASPGQPSNS